MFFIKINYERTKGTIILPSKDETPARWRLKIAKSTAPPEWDCILDSGG
jgi:hypothetical protein